MKRKIKKITKLYRNVLIQKNGAYTFPTDGKYNVIAFTPDVERHFTSVSNAKKYIDKNYSEIVKEWNRPWPKFEKESNDENFKRCITDDN